MHEGLEEFEQTDLTLLETLDHVLNRGMVIAGEITISVADIDLIFLGLNAVLTSVETANEVLGSRRMPPLERLPRAELESPEE
jgi:hypothetical protein